MRKYIYKGMETTDEEIMDEIIFNELSKENKFPSEEMVAQEFICYVEIIEEEEE